MLQQITKENFQQMLGRFTTTELEDLINKFPYFQQAHLLLAKKYQLENNPRFDQQLQLAALYTNDRDLLFSIFHQQNLGNYSSTFIQQPLKQEIKPTESQPVVEEKLEVIIPETPTAEENELSPVNAVMHEEIRDITEQATAESEQQITEVEQVETAETVIEAPAGETFATDEPHTFGDWLKAYSRQLPTIEIPTEKTAEEADKELNKLIMQSVPIDYLQNLVEEETKYAKGLDKFIEEQIERHKQDVVKPAVNEKDLDPELITETMARVYEMQKKYGRAIKAYEVLTLKYPEKSDFFAARINYLKNIL